MTEEDEILSAEVVCSREDIIAEFYGRCEEAAETHDRTKLSEATKDLCRMLDRDPTEKQHREDTLYR